MTRSQIHNKNLRSAEAKTKKSNALTILEDTFYDCIYIFVPIRVRHRNDIFFLILGGPKLYDTLFARSNC